MIAGIDTHTDVHQAVVIDTIGRHLATEAFPTTPVGYRHLLTWLRSHGQVIAVGMEGTGSFGAELSRHLRANQVTVIEVDRPDRRARRAGGKSDPVDAYAAATAVLAGRATCAPKDRDGTVEAIRALRVVRASAVKARTQTINQIRSLIITAPAAVREPLRSLGTTKLIGTETAGQLRVTARDNPERLVSEAAFAHLCAAAPVPASSGRTDRHRLNRAGDRQANRALHTIVVVRMRHDQRTRDYVARRTLEGLKTKDIVRCLKRFVAREVYHHLTSTFSNTPTASPTT